MNFADKIDKSFLTCKFCSQRYRLPKVLKCMHTFCMRCLENYANPGQYLSPRNQYSMASRSLRCPLCRQRTEIPPGGCSRLPDDRIVLRLANIVDRPPTAKTHIICDICRHRGQASPAAYHCIDCSKTLCIMCEPAHASTPVTANHTLVQPDKVDSLICLKHLDETIRFFCSTCSVCICLLCTYEETHKNHDIVTIQEGLQKFQDSLKDDIEECNDKLEKLKDIASHINECERSIGEVRDSINTTVIEFIGTVRKAQYHLLQQIQEAYSDDIKTLIDEKVKVMSMIHNLDRICTDHKDISTKLPLDLLENREKTVAEVSIGRNIKVPQADLDELSKRFYFRRGSVDLGELFNEPKIPNSHIDAAEECGDRFVDIGCQIEPILEKPVDLTSAEVQTEVIANGVETKMHSKSVQTDPQECLYRNISIQTSLCDCCEASQSTVVKSVCYVSQTTQTLPRRMSEHVIFNRVSQGTQYSHDDTFKASFFRSTKSLIIRK